MLRLGSELTGKIAFAGPHKSGKTTNVERIASNDAFPRVGTLLRMHVGERFLKVEGDEVAVDGVPRIDVRDDVYGYELVPLALGNLGGVELKATVYALPGHPDAHDEIDRMWRGIDVLVFVADSRRSVLAANVESWARVQANPWFDPETACILQLNRRDAPDAVPVLELMGALRWKGDKIFEAVASEGIGVVETMTAAVEVTRQRAKSVLSASRS